MPSKAKFQGCKVAKSLSELPVSMAIRDPTVKEQGCKVSMIIDVSDQLAFASSLEP
jgi:hypothetical protein